MADLYGAISSSCTTATGSKLVGQLITILQGGQLSAQSAMGSLIPDLDVINESTGGIDTVLTSVAKKIVVEGASPKEAAQTLMSALSDISNRVAKSAVSEFKGEADQFPGFISS